MNREYENRIPSAVVESFDTWTVPVIEDPDNILQSAEKEDRERREKDAREKGEIIGESVEDADINGPITAADLAELTEQAHQEGYQAGLEKGLEQGLQEGREKGEQQAYDEHKNQLIDICQRLETITSGLLDPFEQETSSLQNIVLNSIVSLSRSVIQRELKLNPSDISQFVNLALDALPKSAKNVQIHLHPKDIALLEKQFPDNATRWTLVPDTEISVGGVVVNTEHSKVDLTIENQLEQLGQQFVRGELFQGDNEDTTTDSEETSEIKPVDSQESILDQPSKDQIDTPSQDNNSSLENSSNSGDQT